MGRGRSDGKFSAGEVSVFHQLQRFVIGLRALGIKNQDAKRVARPAIVPQKTVEVRFLDASLFVNRGDGSRCGVGNFAQARVVGPWTALHGVDERRRAGTKIESSERAAIGRFKKGLVFPAGEK